MDVNHLEYFLEGVPLYICGPGYVGGGAGGGWAPREAGTEASLAA